MTNYDNEHPRVRELAKQLHNTGILDAPGIYRTTEDLTDYVNKHGSWGGDFLDCCEYVASVLTEEENGYDGL